MRQPQAMEHVGDGGERLHDNATGVQGVAHLLERDPSLARHDGPQVVRVLLQQGTPRAANLGWGQAAGLAHPLHQLDGRRGAHGEAAGGLPDRAATLDSMHDPLPEILGQGGRHEQLHHSRPRHPGIRSSDSVQDRTALVLQLHLCCECGPLLGACGRGGAAMSVAVWSGALVAWERELAALKERIGPVFGRAEVRETAGAFLDGLLSGVARKTGWLLAEQAGLERPYRMQSLLGRSRWDADALRDRIRADVIEALGDRDGVLVVDETGFLKKGEHSVGVARQYSGTAGRIENCQIGVFLAYASRYGQALIDRRLYLPDAWAQDESKRAKAGVPEEITFATKPKIARDLIAAALDAGAPCAWVLADALYGSDSRLRRMLETREQPYVLAVRSNHCLRFWTEEGLEETDPAAMADALASEAWATHAAGEGSKGLRLYEWARITLPSTADPGFEHWLLIRRSRREPDQRAYYFAFAPAGVSLGELAGAAGLRWVPGLDPGIEECFERAKDDLGLDHCEAHSWRRLGLECGICRH